MGWGRKGEDLRCSAQAAGHDKLDARNLFKSPHVPPARNELMTAGHREHVSADIVQNIKVSDKLFVADEVKGRKLLGVSSDAAGIHGGIR